MNRSTTHLLGWWQDTLDASRSVPYSLCGTPLLTEPATDLQRTTCQTCVTVHQRRGSRRAVGAPGQDRHVDLTRERR